VDERVQVRTFHGWCKDVVDSYQLDVPWVPDKHAQFHQMVSCVERSLKTGFVPGGQYCALLVDEAHDFEDAWLRMAVRLVDPATNSLLVLYDDAQSIYQKRRRKFTMASVGIQAQGRTSILKLNYRNTAEVLSLAVQVAQSLLQGGLEELDEQGGIPLVQPASAGRRGSVPLLIEARSTREEARWISDRVSDRLAGGASPSDIAILARTRSLLQPLEQALARRKLPVQSMAGQAVRSFDWSAPSVKLLTLHSAKGLEFPSVHIAGLQAMPLKDELAEDAARLLYVGMTRATQELTLSCSGPSTMVERVRTALEAVRRQWGG
jgi:superfamily I DNA/RNA helicase